VAFGPQAGAMLGADTVGDWAETIPYEILTGVGKRVPRVYLEEFPDG